jgi:hypothetical protein
MKTVVVAVVVVVKNEQSEDSTREGSEVSLVRRLTSARHSV